MPQIRQHTTHKHRIYPRPPSICICAISYKYQTYLFLLSSTLSSLSLSFSSPQKKKKPKVKHTRQPHSFAKPSTLAPTLTYTVIHNEIHSVLCIHPSNRPCFPPVLITSGISHPIRQKDLGHIHLVRRKRSPRRKYRGFTCSEQTKRPFAFCFLFTFLLSNKYSFQKQTNRPPAMANS